MRSAIKRVLRAYTEKVCYCERCGKRVRVCVSKESKCPCCEKRMRPLPRAY